MVQEGWDTVPVKGNELKKHKTKKRNRKNKTNHDIAEESDDKRGEAVPVHENAAQNQDHQANRGQPEGASDL